MKSFWRDGLSVDETKFSSIMLLLFIFSGIGIYMIYQVGDMPTNLTNFLYVLVGGITGINIVSRLSNKKSNTQQVDDSDMDNNHYYTTEYDNYEPQKEVIDRAPI